MPAVALASPCNAVIGPRVTGRTIHADSNAAAASRPQRGYVAPRNLLSLRNLLSAPAARISQLQRNPRSNRLKRRITKTYEPALNTGPHMLDGAWQLKLGHG